MVRFPWRRGSDDPGGEPERNDRNGESESDDPGGGTDTGDPADEERTPDHDERAGPGGRAGPGESGDERTEGVGEDPFADYDEKPVVSCQFQDGRLTVYPEVVHVERAPGSKFSDKWIAMNQVRGVSYVERLVIHYIQIEQVDFEADEPSFLSTPVDENTLHFGHGKRDCARQARDAILERASAD